jgi:hypothetical protein
MCVAEDLHTSRQWLNLLYYEKVGDGYVSVADDDRFFVSESGKTDPKGEYEASLKLTVSQDSFFRKTFPLRYKLISHLNLLPYEPLVTPNSEVTSAVIAFPNRYMGNPASMFGHLFIILQSKHGVMDSDLLHYLADTAGSDSSAYIFNGLTGHFKGWFLREPYYKKIKDYNYVEDREVVYYDLSLSQTQLEDLQLHAVELQQTYFSYYFLDENCAFFTGKLLNVVLDEDILSRSTLVFPSQIINSLYDQSLLTSEYRRKPSTQLFNESFDRLNRSERDAVIALLVQERDPISLNVQVLKTFLYISEYMINNNPGLAQIIRHNRIAAYKVLAGLGESAIRPTNRKQDTVSRIRSNGVHVGYGFLDQTFLSYAPIYYGEYESFGDLEVKKLNLFSPGVVLGPEKSPLLSVMLADIANITPYNEVLSAYSWKLNSWLGYRKEFLSDNSFELGQSHHLLEHGAFFGFLGVHYTNYNTLIEQELGAFLLRPSITFGIDYMVIPELLTLKTAYQYQFNHNYFTMDLSFYTMYLVPQLSYVRGDDDFEGLRLLVTSVF